MAGQPAAPQLAVSILAAPPRRTEAKKIAGPPPKISTFSRLRRRASTFSPCIFLAVEGLCLAHGPQQKPDFFGMQAPGIHFQHPDQPPCAATLPQTHPLKTRISTLLPALHFMRDWQVNPFYHGFRHLPSLFSSLGIWRDFCPTPEGRTHTRTRGRLTGLYSKQAPIINWWVFPLTRERFRWVGSSLTPTVTAVS
jgi:hypothetical protein